MAVTDLKALKATVIAHAHACGFDLAGVTSTEDFAADREAALERIRDGQMDGLPWYTESRVMRGTSPSELLPGARSIVCLGLSYLGDIESGQSGAGDEGVDPAAGAVGQYGTGRVARYAWVKNYHKAMKRRMREFVRGLERELDSTIAARWYVDDGPMLDRAAANRAGLGWFGKNTNILTPGFGSWVFLGQVITDLELEPDAPLSKTCGNCVRCMVECPTGAITAPYVVDNTRCISYLTIENRGPIPREFRPLIGDWVFGCDICQGVCPVNRKAQASTQSIEAANQGGERKPIAILELTELLEMSEEDFRARFAGTSVMRAKRVGMQRNACVALGNAGDESALPSLVRAIGSAEPLVRGHAAWALGRIGGGLSRKTLSAAALTETETDVLAEIRAALSELA